VVSLLNARRFWRLRFSGAATPLLEFLSCDLLLPGFFSFSGILRGRMSFVLLFPYSAPLSLSLGFLWSFQFRSRAFSLRMSIRFFQLRFGFSPKDFLSVGPKFYSFSLKPAIVIFFLMKVMRPHFRPLLPPPFLFQLFIRPVSPPFFFYLLDWR